MCAELLVVFGAEFFSCLGDGASRPPAADCARDPTEERTDRAGGGTDPRTNQHASDPTRRLPDFVTETRPALVRAKRGVFRALDPSIRRRAFGYGFVSIRHAPRHGKLFLRRISGFCVPFRDLGAADTTVIALKPLTSSMRIHRCCSPLKGPGFQDANGASRTECDCAWFDFLPGVDKTIERGVQRSVYGRSRRIAV
jgi:hypothetical protein